MAMEVDGDSKMECVKFMFFEGRLTKVICTFPNNLDKFQMNIYDYDTTVVNLPEGFPS